VARRSDPNFPQSVYHACFRELRDAFGELRNHMKGIAGTRDLRFVVFVDDLDRCLPQGALEVLEAMKLFFEMDGFVFVVGLDRSIVERFIEQRYSEVQGWTTTTGADGAVVAVPEKRTPLLSGAEYIKKIFQVPYTLTPVQLSQLDDLMDVIDQEAELPPEQADDLRGRIQRHLRVALSEVAVNPREVKRFINSYVMQMKINPHLEPDVVLALQTIKARSDWDAVHQAVGIYRDEFLIALKDCLNGDTKRMAAVDPELKNLPDSFMEYVNASGPAHILVTIEPSSIDEYLYSVESTGTTHGAVLLDVMPLLVEARSELEHATTGDLGPPFSRAQQSLRKARSVVSALETFPAIRGLVQDLDKLATELVPPASGVFESAEIETHTKPVRDEITGLIRRARALRRRDLDAGATA
jgi:hypothetical protein